MRLQLHISPKCGLRCEYCVSNMNLPGAQEAPSIFDDITTDQYVESIGRLFSKHYPMTIELGGPGEPTDNPGFERIANHFLDGGNSVKVYTNTEHYKKLLSLHRPELLSIDASFHFDSYLRHLSFSAEKFLHRLKSIKNAGIAINVLITPLSPLVLEHADEYMAIAGAAREFVTSVYPVQMYHFYDTLEYPASYTEEESAKVREIISAFRKPDFADVREESNSYDSMGNECRVFSQFAMITAQGDIQHCQSDPQFTVGNIADYGGEVYVSPMPCPAKTCLCQGFYKEYMKR